MAKFLNIHILSTFAGANPNRDDVGAPKTLIYGGVERSRMSSQAMTRAKRRGYEDDPAGERAYRSKCHASNVEERVVEVLTQRGVAVTDLNRSEIVRLSIASTEMLVNKDAVNKSKKASDGKGAKAKKGAETVEETSDDTDAKNAISLLAEEEIARLVDKIAAAMEKGETKDVPALDFVEPQTSSLSIAGYGRMFANQPKMGCEAAIQRTNAFTTHQSALEMDYFSAFDDLRTEDNGAGHLGLKQLTGGVYYWHASIDREQLEANLVDLAGVSDERFSAFVRHLLADLPRGNKANSTIGQVPAFILISESDAPISLQSAFETPVQMGEEGGYLKGSVKGLEDEFARGQAFDPSKFGAPIRGGLAIEGGSSFDEIVASVVSWIRGGK